MPSRNIDLGFEGEQPLTIAADGDRLRELINNLIDNAIRYSEPGGRVTVRTGRSADGHCRLAISDDGPSIPVAERQRIFERFHRLLGTQEDGSGLGLAIVSEIATCTARASSWRRTWTAWATPSASLRRAGHRRAPRGRPPRPGGRRVADCLAGRQLADKKPTAHRQEGSQRSPVASWHRHQRLVPFHSTRRHHGFPVQPGVLGCAFADHPDQHRPVGRQRGRSRWPAAPCRPGSSATPSSSAASARSCCA